uniref:C2 domain-containing protein n=1 Tax=Glossina brevipalpis TaxID=37001 RepID=A0A1A9WWW5_9MUSC
MFLFTISTISKNDFVPHHLFQIFGQMLKWTKQQQQLSNLSSLALQQQSKAFQKSIYKQRYSTENFQTSSKTKKSDFNKMPTMNNYTLERRLHRRSLDNQLDAVYEEERNRRNSRVSLTSMDNKENFGIHFMRNSLHGNTSLTALQDLSNGKSPRRSINEQTPPMLNVKRRCETENTRFSDNFCETNDLTPLTHFKYRNKIKEESLSSSRMGDVTLDRMLDAIIESARKEAKPISHILKVDRENEKILENSGNNSMDISVHEMEVRTPQHLKRQRKVVRRKKTDKKMKQQVNRKTEMIGLTLPNGIPSPGTPIFKRSIIDDNYEEELFTPSPPIGELQLCSTPTLEETRVIKRCLSFSCHSEDDEGEEYLQFDTKRNSVASSIASSTTEQLTSSNSMTPIKGSLDLAIYAHQGILNVHVIRCRDLQRANGCSSLNAYVKVAVICKSQPGTGFQRTAVHRHSSRPFFDHHFKFNLKYLYDIIDDIQDEDRLQLAVWHRDRQLKPKQTQREIVMMKNQSTLNALSVNKSFRLQKAYNLACLERPPN